VLGRPLQFESRDPMLGRRFRDTGGLAMDPDAARQTGHQHGKAQQPE
jgi:hypothetical protein